MKIAMDIRGVYLYHGTGIGTYTKNLISNLLKIDHENYYDLFYCGKYPRQFNQNNTRLHLISRKHSSFFEQKYIPHMLNENNIAIFHVPQNGIGYSNLIPSNKFKFIVTLHDLIPYVHPNTTGKSYLKNFLKQLPYIIENCSSIITVSNYSRNEIIKFFSVDPQKICVTHLAADEKFKPMNKFFCKSFIKQKYNIDSNFILYVGGFSKRKNIYNLILSFEHAYKNFNKNTKLVLLGNIKSGFNELIDLVYKKNLQSNILFTGFIPEEELPIFYNASLFFVYISIYEGFGLPVLEAMNCKKAVLSSNQTSLPEIVENHSYSVNPYDIYEISNALCRLCNDKILRNELEEKGYEQSKKFSWEKCSQSTIDLYRNLLNSYS